MSNQFTLKARRIAQAALADGQPLQPWAKPIDKAFQPLDGTHPVELQAHQHGCRWPIDREPPLAALFCNAEPAPGHVYCARHRAMALRVEQPRHKVKEPPERIFNGEYRV